MEQKTETWQETLLRIAGIDIAKCPACGERTMRMTEIMLPARCKGSDDGFQTSLGKYNNLLVQRMDVCSMKPLFTKPHSYPLTFEFHDDITERMTWPTPVKILLTPLTVVADIVLTPSFAVLSYIMEDMPR